jgi:hypothetical protein
LVLANGSALWGIVKCGDNCTVQRYDATLDVSWLLHGDSGEAYTFDNVAEAMHICSLMPIIMDFPLSEKVK